MAHTFFAAKGPIKIVENAFTNTVDKTMMLV